MTAMTDNALREFLQALTKLVELFIEKVQRDGL
jgi:hypothetical protein